MRRQVNFSSILDSLIDAGGYRGNRSKILEATGVTSSALSQYLGGQSKPSFQTLVALAQFFGVTLDYLVFGDNVGQEETPDFGPLARYVDVSLRRVDERAQERSAMVARIGTILSQKIDDVANELTQVERAGVASLLHLFRVGLHERDVVQCSADAVNSQCELRLTDVPIFSGLALYWLDINAYRSSVPALYEMVSMSIDEEGWAGHAVPPHGATYSTSMFDELHLRNSRKQFDYLWKRGTRV